LTIFATIPYESRTVPAVIQRSAGQWGDKVFLNRQAEAVSFTALKNIVARAGGGFAELGVQEGDVGAVFMPNCLELLYAWWGLNWIGAVAALMHPGYKGEFLTRALQRVKPKVVVVDGSFVPELLRALQGGTLGIETIVVINPAETSPFDINTLSWSAVATHAPVEATAVRPLHPSTIIYTSGTTSWSKAALLSHHYVFTYGALAVDGQQLEDSDNIYECRPCSHVGPALSAIFAGLMCGAEVTLRPKFSASGFWADLALTKATRTTLIGSMANIMQKQAPGPSDRAHCMRSALSLPPPLDPPGFEERFNLKLLAQGYGMTEVWPLPQQLELQDWSRPLNFIGRPHEQFEVRVADEDGRPVAADGITRGELLVRPKAPGLMFTEYYNDPQATVEAFRDAWFHTGDLVSIDTAGGLYFQGRKTQYLRRGGENISEFELETAVLAHPSVKEVAAYGLPSELGEDDVKVDVILVEGKEISAEALVAYLKDNVPRYAVPRYVEIRTSFPKTPSERVQKYLLKQQEIGPHVYDRERAERR